MPAIAGIRTHMARPAAEFNRLGPFRADQDVRTVDVVDGAVARAVVRDLLLGAADAQDERLPLQARDRVYAGNLEKIGMCSAL